MMWKKWVFHVEFLLAVVLITAILVVHATREIPVSVEVDTDPIREANTELMTEVNQLVSLHELYSFGLEELRALSACGGLDRLSSEEAIVGRVFYINGEPFFYYLSLREYNEAEFNAMTNSKMLVDGSYIRPLTGDIEFLARQFKERYPDKTERALAISSLIQNLEYDEIDEDSIKHPTVTLMSGGTSFDLAIAFGALLKAADINCALLIFKDERQAAIGISDIDFEKFQEKISGSAIIEFEGRKYLICETTSLRHPAGSELRGIWGSSGAETVDLIIPYEFP